MTPAKTLTLTEIFKNKKIELENRIKPVEVIAPKISSFNHQDLIQNDA